MKENKGKLPFAQIKDKLIPHIGVVFSVFIILVIYFKPIMLENKRLIGHDQVQFQGMVKEMVDYREKTGKQALWTNRLFGGMPAFQLNMHYPKNILEKFYYTYIGALKYPVSAYFLLFLGFYCLLIFLGAGPWVSGLGALAFMFSSYFFVIVEAGHASKVFAIAFWSFIILGILMVYQKKYLAGAVITSLAVGMEVFMNHYQITFYLLFIIAALAINEFYQSIKEKKVLDFFKGSAILIAAALIGIGPNITRLWTTLDYADITIRGKSELKAAIADNPDGGLDREYALRWSYGKAETFTLLVPNVYGGSSQDNVGENSETFELLKKSVGGAQAKKMVNNWPTYYGDQPFTSGPVYVGAIICFLFLLGMLVLPNKIRWWLLAVTLLGTMLSWGRHFPFLTDIFFDYLPMYDKFRAVSMMLVIPEFTLPLIGTLGLAQVIKKGKKNFEAYQKKLFIAAGVTAGISALFVIAAPVMYEMLQASGTMQRDLSTLSRMFGQSPESQIVNDFAQALADDRASMIRADALRSLLLILLSAGAIWLYLKGKITELISVAAITGLIAFDLVPVAHRYLNEESFTKKPKKEQFFKPTPVDLQILQDKELNYRVFNLTTNTYNEAATSYFHNSVGGYNPAKLRRYQDLIDYHLSGKINQNVVNMLNTKYVIQNRQKPQAQLNPGRLGNAWFVQEVKWVSDPDEEINAMSDFNPAITAIVDQSKWGEIITNPNPVFDSTATIRLVSYSPNELSYESVTGSNQIAVFSEIYYDEGKGWNVYVDGNKVPHFRANYVLRAMEVPAGKHTIEFKFEPQSYYLGEKISLIFSLILIAGILGLIGSGVYSVRKRGSLDKPNKE